MKKSILSIFTMLIVLVAVGNTSCKENVVIKDSKTNIELNNNITTGDWEDYLEGWEEGHCEGWRDVKGAYANCPNAPNAPNPGVGKMNYKGGYNAGFKAGSKAARD
jgi:hypothetical protein